jgi:hypothetical protein
MLDEGAHRSMAAHGNKMDWIDCTNSPGGLLEESQIRRSRSDGNGENDLTGIIASVIQIPRNHYDLGNVSMYSLLANSGYLEFPTEISEDDILQGLQIHPECIQDWRVYSEDKRTTGWYLKEPSSGCYGIGYISVDGENRRDLWEYHDDASPHFSQA